MDAVLFRVLSVFARARLRGEKKRLVSAHSSREHFPRHPRKRREETKSGASSKRVFSLSLSPSVFADLARKKTHLFLN
jgi:hypothetical protein